MGFCWYIALKRLFSSDKIIKFGGGVMNNENWTPEQIQQNQQQNYQPSVRKCNDGQGLSIAALAIGFSVAFSFLAAELAGLAAARSRSGSDSPPDCHSLPSRRFATRWIQVPVTSRSYRFKSCYPHQISTAIMIRNGIVKAVLVFY